MSLCTFWSHGMVIVCCRFLLNVTIIVLPHIYIFIVVFHSRICTLMKEKKMQSSNMPLGKFWTWPFLTKQWLPQVSAWLAFGNQKLSFYKPPGVLVTLLISIWLSYQEVNNPCYLDVCFNFEKHFNCYYLNIIHIQLSIGDNNNNNNNYYYYYYL